MNPGGEDPAACLSSPEQQPVLTGVCAVGHDQHPQRGEVDVSLIPVCYQRPVHVPGLNTGHFCWSRSRRKGSYYVDPDSEMLKKRTHDNGGRGPRGHPRTYLCTGRPSESRRAGSPSSVSMGCWSRASCSWRSEGEDTHRWDREAHPWTPGSRWGHKRTGVSSSQCQGCWVWAGGWPQGISE